MSVKGTLQDIHVDYDCDEEQLEECQCMYVLVEQTEALKEVVEGTIDETSDLEQKTETPASECPKTEAKLPKDADNNFLLMWAEKQEEKLKLEIEFMKEEHLLKMKKLQLEIERLSKTINLICTSQHSKA